MLPRWSQTFRIQAVDQKWEKMPATPGIYIIMKKKPIKRIGGIDSNGILYVGKALTIRKRLGQFWSADHIASDFLRMNLPLTRIFLGKWVDDEKDLYPLLGKLYVRIATPISGKGKLDEAEWATLFAYVYRFGELPPLNFSLRKRWGVNPQGAL